MKKINHIYKVTNLYCDCVQQLLKNAIGDGMAPAGEREQIAKIKQEINSYNWNGSTESLEEFEAGFNKFLTICEYIGMLPSPVGNPFSLALVGEDLAQGDYSSAAMDLLGGLPWLSLIRKGALMLKVANFVSKLLKSCPVILRPAIQAVLLWIANSMEKIAAVKIAAYGSIIAAQGIIGKLPGNLLITTARKVGATGYTSSVMKKSIDDNNFNALDAALYLSDFLMKTSAREIAEISQQIKSANN